MKKLISIIIPCFKGEAYLNEAIESCSAQCYMPYEVVIVNDASPDNCESIAATFAANDQRCLVISHSENRGVAEAFNTGFNAAKGDYLTRLAQDDLLKPGVLDAMAEYLDEHPDVDMVYADMEYIDKEGNVTGVFHAKSTNQALKTSYGIGVCWMFRRKIWDDGFRFDPRYDQVEDFEFVIRVSRSYSLSKYCGEPLLQFRIHDASGTSKHAAKMEIKTAGILAEYADSPEISRNAVAIGYFNASYIFRKQGDQRSAIQYAFQALKIKPFEWRFYRNLAGALLNR